MLQMDMVSKVRTVFGKGPMRQLRMKDLTPGILYGGGTEPMPLQFDSSQLFKKLVSLQGRNAVLTLEVEGDSKDKRHVLLQEIQKEPVSGHLVHVDFLEINLENNADFVVPIEYTGTSKGVDMGGELKVFKNEVVLRGRPLDIPDVIEADITELEQGGASLTYGDLNVPEGVEMLENEAAVCVTVY